MKKTINIFKYFILGILLLISGFSFADGSINSFYKGSVKGSLKDVISNITSALKSSDFEIKGEYHPGKIENWYIIAFTRKDLSDITLKVKNRGAMASVLKIGLISDGKGNIEVSLLNPTYVFYGYLRDEVDKNEETLNSISMEAMVALSGAGISLLPFESGSLSENELKQYRFMVKMPNFDEAIPLKQFNSFNEGLSMIKKNLSAQRGGTFKVYELLSESDKIALFGIGLLDDRLGEAKFIPILGESHLAAMPFELIILDNQVFMLSPRFRFPFYWPDLSMKEFQKIGRTNRDIQTMLENLTK